MIWGLDHILRGPTIKTQWQWTPYTHVGWNRCPSVHLTCPSFGLALWVKFLTPDPHGASSQSQFSKCLHGQWKERFSIPGRTGSVSQLRPAFTGIPAGYRQSCTASWDDKPWVWELTPRWHKSHPVHPHTLRSQSQEFGLLRGSDASGDCIWQKAGQRMKISLLVRDFRPNSCGSKSLIAPLAEMIGFRMFSKPNLFI